MTFDEAAAAADQEFELVQDSNGTVEYATKYTFQYLSTQLYNYNL